MLLMVSMCEYHKMSAACVRIGENPAKVEIVQPFTFKEYLESVPLGSRLAQSFFAKCKTLTYFIMEYCNFTL